MNTTSNHLKVTQNSIIDHSGIAEYFYLKLPLKPVESCVENHRTISLLLLLCIVKCLPKDIIQLNYLLCAPKLNEFCYFQKFNHRLEINLVIQQKRCQENRTYNAAILLSLTLQWEEKNTYMETHEQETNQFHIRLKAAKE